MNANNIFNLIKRYFIESGRKDINSFLLIVLIIAFVSFFSVSGSISGSMMVFLLVLMGIIYASKVFGIFQPAGKAIHYLTIPASTAEKTMANSLLVFVYYNILLMASLLLGNLIGGLAHKLLDPAFTYHFYMPFDFDDLLMLLVLESVYLFGSIYFKNRAAIKTSLVIFTVFLFFIILDTIILGQHVNHFNQHSIQYTNEFFSKFNFEWIEYGISALVFVFFNFMTWLRLRETEA
ncbi:MAG: hypothetical protein J5644_07725 [Bacteroidales bacterium]|nr:hypothetical protein [Bacteroidales bacterium]